MINRGWIKLWRKTIESPMLQDEYLLQLWIYILLGVNHKEKRIIWNGTELTIKAGEGVFGTTQMVFDLTKCKSEEAKDFSKLKSRYYRKMLLLGKLQKVQLNSTSKYTIISVVDWHNYQSDETQMQHNCNTDATQVQPNKNDKNVKNVKNSPYEKEFSALWNFYPKKKSRKSSLAAYISVRKRKVEAEVLLKATKNYAEWVKKENKSEAYILMASTFFNQERYEDFIEGESESGLSESDALMLKQAGVKEEEIEKLRRKNEDSTE